MGKLTDWQWQVISPLIRAQSFVKGGRPRASDRDTLDAILWVVFTRKRWVDLSKEYGSYVTAWRRLYTWRKDGTWIKIVKTLQSLLSLEEALLLEIEK